MKQSMYFTFVTLLSSLSEKVIPIEMKAPYTTSSKSQIVYVDAEGYIEDGNGHRFEDQNAIAKILYKNYRRGSIEQQAQWNIQPGKTYSIIEPIQVELLYQWKGCGGNKWLNTNKDYWNSVYHPAEKRIVARIVTDLEESIENQLFWYWIVSTPGCSVDSVWVQHNGVSRPVAVFRVTSIKGCPL